MSGARGPFDMDHWRAASPARLADLRHRLAHPPMRLSPTELAALFVLDRIRVVARRPDGLQDYPDFAVRLRGAFGRVLASLGPPLTHRHDVAARPRAWDILFESMALPGERLAVAKPLVIKATVERDHVVACAGLIGLAGFWLPDAGAALVGALEGGISLRNGGRMKIPLECLEATHLRSAGLTAPLHAVREARLHFRTPLRLRAGDALAMSEASFPIALANRVARVAPWLSARLDLDWSEAHERARALDVDTRDLTPYRWSRGTQRVQGKLPVLGLIGTLVLRGDLEFWTPLLQIAEAVNVGAHASIGLGAFNLVLLP